MSTETIRIKAGTLIDPTSALHRETVDILIENGIITSISKSSKSSKAATEIDATGGYIMPGLMDLRCQLKDPGYEHKETIASGALAAAASGFTGIAVHPTTYPVTQSKSQVEYLKNVNHTVLPDLIPIGATTEDTQSGDITEMYDMYQAGARAFSNGDKPYANGGTLLRALLYSKSFGGLVMSHAIDENLTKSGAINESVTTIHTGLKAQPAIAESSQVKKEIDIAEYAEGRIHFSHISTKESVEAIRSAKKRGVQVSCDVSIWHLVYTDESVLDYNTNFKLTPPLRTEKDRKALIKAVNDGTIDAIVSDHNPQNVERKRVEFDYASYGINGLQSFYSVYNQHLTDAIPLETFVRVASANPRVILGLPEAKIEAKQQANLWVAMPKRTWTLNKSTNHSVAENNPLFDTELTGQCTFVINGTNHLSF